MEKSRQKEMSRLIKKNRNTPIQNNTNEQGTSTNFVVRFYDAKIIVPRNSRNTVITLLHRSHPSINKLSHAAKPIWWPKMSNEIQQKLDDCIPCKMTGKDIKFQLPMTEVIYLLPIRKSNWISLDQ